VAILAPQYPGLPAGSGHTGRQTTGVAGPRILVKILAGWIDRNAPA